MQAKPVHIIGAGLAGSEAAWQLAQQGIPVTIHEMRPIVKTEAHQTGDCAELVCSNSFRSDDDEYNAVGLLHWEMRQFNSLIMDAADVHKVPAGGALAVDRDLFSSLVTERLRNHPLITFEPGEITSLPPDDGSLWLIATGPLTGSGLANDIRAKTGEDSLAFFDAIAPIVYTESINMDVAWYQSRYDKEGPAGTGKDYINCPLSKDQYLNLMHEQIPLTPSSRNGKRIHLISKAACRSRSWHRAGSTRCVMAR
jgi:methylenetetrahydrofolate--tRNA-(uracil-5-)-methyltransferase